MQEIPQEIATRLQLYLDTHALDTEILLGWGVDGFVWRTSRVSALKIHKHRSEYRQERDVYLRLRQRSLSRLAGFHIPELLDFDDSSLALEMSVVDRPFVLDFAQAGLDLKFSQLEDPDWLAEKARLFGRDWNDVQRLSLAHKRIKPRAVARESPSLAAHKRRRACRAAAIKEGRGFITRSVMTTRLHRRAGNG